MKKTLIKYLFAASILGMAFQTSIIKTIASDKTVPLETRVASDFVGATNQTATYVDKGAHVSILGADTVGTGEAWRQQARLPNSETFNESFSLENGPIEFSFSMAYYDEAGNVISQSQNDGGGALDIYAFDASTDNQLALLRIWVNSGNPLNGNHSMAIFGADWNEGYSSNYWIMGDATASSEFYIRFDKENVFSSYVGGSSNMTVLSEGLKNNVSPKLANVDNVYFKFAGNNGFTKTMDFCLHSVNGQSLANDGVNFIDTVAPKFIESNIPTTINLNREYTLPVTAYDLLSDVTYEVQVGTQNKITGKSFTPTEVGTLPVTLFVTDAAGNTSSRNYEFQVEEMELENAPRIDYINGNYSSDLGLRFLIRKEYLLNYESYSVEVKKAIYTGDAISSYEMTSLSNLGTTTVENIEYYVFGFNGIKFYEMTSEITCNVSIVDAGETTVVDTLKLSFASYSKQMLEAYNNGTSTISYTKVQIIRQLLSLGELSQIDHQYHLGDLASAYDVEVSERV